MTEPRLPGADQAMVEQKKVESYLLDQGHKDGGPKARFFLKRGFTPLLWKEFADALIEHGKANRVTRIAETEWGLRYRVECNCRTPDGLNPCIRTVWEIARDGDYPRLLTAHPLKN